MNELGYGKAIVLGIIQGLTEFLPVSSSAHLALGQRWLQLDPNSAGMLLFDVLVHLGTLVAVGIVFYTPACRLLRRLRAELSGKHKGKGYACRLLGFTVLASIPTAIIGLTCKDTFEAAFDRPKWIGACLLVTGFLLVGTRKLYRGSRGWRQFAGWQAVLIGVVQGLAILPGISRSGATISVAMFCGLRRRWAGEFSFLIAAPAILGATAIKVKDTMAIPAGELSIDWGPLVMGSVVSLLVGVAALSMLMSVVRRAKLQIFSPYCWLIGGAALAGLL